MPYISLRVSAGAAPSPAEPTQKVLMDELFCLFCQVKVRSALGFMPQPDSWKFACCEKCCTTLFALARHLGPDLTLWALYGFPEQGDEQAPPEPIEITELDASEAVQAAERLLRGE